MKFGEHVVPDKFYMVVSHHKRTTILGNTYAAFTIIDECTPSEMMTEDEAAKAIPIWDAIAVLQITWDAPPEDVTEKICKVWWNQNYTTLEPGEAGEPLGVPDIVKHHCDQEITNWTGEYHDMQRAGRG